MVIGIGIGVFLVLAVSGAVLFMNKKADLEIKIFAPAGTQRVVDDIYVINDEYVNFYLVKTDSGFISIDTGASPDKIEIQLKKINLEPSKVEAVFLTHTDADHTGGLQLFPNAKVYMSSEEEQMINGKTRRAIFFRNKLPVTNYNLIADNQTIEVSGLKMQGIFTPGHTAGSMSYVVADTYLFTGDTLSIKKGEAGTFPGFFNMSTKRQRESITKISRLPNIKYVFTAHHGYTGDFKTLFANWKSQ